MWKILPMDVESRFLAKFFFSNTSCGEVRSSTHTVSSSMNVTAVLFPAQRCTSPSSFLPRCTELPHSHAQRAVGWAPRSWSRGRVHLLRTWCPGAPTARCCREKQFEAASLVRYLLPSSVVLLNA